MPSPRHPLIPVLATGLGILMATLGTADDRPASTRYAVAIESGDLEAVEMILAEGIGPEVPIEYGERKVPPLAKAAWEGQYEIAELLLAKGADPNAVESGGTTALMNAITRGWDDLFDLLLSAGADPNLVNDYQQDALQGAIHADRPDWIERLVAAGAKLEPNAYGYTPLMTAAAGSRLDSIEFLAARGADLDAQNEHGNTALLTAVLTNQTKAVRVLLELGADPSLGDSNGSPLDMARKYERDEIVALLEAALEKP